MNIAGVLTALGVAVLYVFIRNTFFYRTDEKIVPKPASLFIVTDAVNGYGFELTKTIAEAGFQVLGIVRNLADAELLRGLGVGKIDVVIDTAHDMSAPVEGSQLCPIIPELATSLESYDIMNVTLSGIVVVLTPRHFYDKSNDYEMTGFGFAMDVLADSIMSLIAMQTALPDYKGEAMRVALVVPYIPPPLYAIPHRLNTTEMAELVVIRALDAAVAEARRHFAQFGVSISLVYSPSRYAPNETLIQV